jgi:hypothetical protein
MAFAARLREGHAVSAGGVVLRAMNGVTICALLRRSARSPRRCPGLMRCRPFRAGNRARCGGGAQANRDRACDSNPGAGDGRCDACPVGFGVTTDDEMFVLTGSYIGETEDGVR